MAVKGGVILYFSSCPGSFTTLAVPAMPQPCHYRSPASPPASALKTPPTEVQTPAQGSALLVGLGSNQHRTGMLPGLNPGRSCPLRGAGPFPESCRVPPKACVNLPAWDMGKAFEEMLGTENVMNSVLKRGFPGAMAVHTAKSHPHQSHQGYSKGV